VEGQGSRRRGTLASGGGSETLGSSSVLGPSPPSSAVDLLPSSSASRLPAGASSSYPTVPASDRCLPPSSPYFCPSAERNGPSPFYLGLRSSPCCYALRAPNGTVPSPLGYPPSDPPFASPCRHQQQEAFVFATRAEKRRARSAGGTTRSPTPTASAPSASGTKSKITSGSSARTSTPRPSSARARASALSTSLTMTECASLTTSTETASTSVATDCAPLTMDALAAPPPTPRANAPTRTVGGRSDSLSFSHVPFSPPFLPPSSHVPLARFNLLPPSLLPRFEEAVAGDGSSLRLSLSRAPEAAGALG